MMDRLIDAANQNDFVVIQVTVDSSAIISIP